MTDLLLGIGIPFNIGSGFAHVPFIEFTSLLVNSVRKAQDENGYEKDAFSYGIRLERGFAF